jgi:hypothetical protein
MTAAVLATRADARSTAAECGSAALLPKPFEVDELLATIARCLPPAM